MPGRIEFDFLHQPAQRRRRSSTLRILLMGDFSGRGSRGDDDPGDLASRPLLPLDVDKLETQLDRLAPRLRLDLPGGPVEPAFRELDDFHPDALYRDLPLFQSLRSSRRRLADPDTFHQAAEELGLAPSRPERTEKPAPATASPLDELLGGRSLGSGGPARGAADTLFQTVVGPHVRPDTTGQDQYLAAVDSAIAEQMRRVLHHPDFQALEAAWRWLAELTSRVETGPDLKLYLLDISREELTRDLRDAGQDLSRSALHQRLVEGSAEPWSALIGDYTFGPGEADARLLAALGAVASRAGGPFLAGASPRLLGVDALDPAPGPAHWPGLDAEGATWWQALRDSPMAPWLGLLLPRVLLRLPYGRRLDPIDSFDFEEIPGQPHTGELLWGNPAFAAAILLAQAFLEQGEGPQLLGGMELDDLPAYSYQRDGESVLHPVTEARLGEQAVNALLDAGLMPLMGQHHGTILRLPRWQCLSATALAGL